MSTTLPSIQDSTLRHIVVVGGSYGGVSIAHHLLKHTLPLLQSYGRYKLILISTSSEILCRPVCPRAMISDEMFDQRKLFVDIAKTFEQYPREQFSFVHGTATLFDHNERTITIDLAVGGTQTIDFHALVIATGASTPSPLLGLTGDAQTLRHQWANFRKALPRAKSIVIAGGGPAGIETAGELGEYLNGRAGWFSSGLGSPKVRITVVTAGERILPVLRSTLADQAEAMLAKLGVTVMRGVRVDKVDLAEAGTATTVVSAAILTLSNGQKLEADLYIPATGTKPNTSFISSSILTADGRVEVNPSTLRVDKAGPRIYAIGDASSFARPAVHNTLEAVPVLGNNLKGDILLEVTGSEGGPAVPPEKSYKPDNGETQLVPIGRRTGVGAFMGWKMPGWVIWMIKGRDYWLWSTPRLWSGKQWEKEK